MSESANILLPFAATLVAFALLWPVSLRLSDASVVDLWWAPGFPVQIGFGAAIAGQWDGRAALILGLVGLWALRLGITMARRRARAGHEDPRYAALRASWGAGFWWKSFFIVFLLQAVIQWAVALGPLLALAEPSRPLGWLAGAGALLALAGFLLEAAADRQLDHFKAAAAPGQLCDCGLRAHVRHPNYLGEIMFWAGIALIGLEAGAWGALVSPILIALLLVKVSGAPMLDEHLGRTRPGWAAYRARVPAFLPRLTRAAPAQKT